ncbi:ArsC family reductase [Hwanghaeella sp.]|uniref:ArsC family reductase n=1 Tax=Hwanghaeella sp. TaxID=2605943 RepID=UPI003CCBFC7A
MIVIHGLKNCDTCKKARKWAEQEGLEHRFHDVRADGLTGGQLDAWLKQVSWEVLLNRRGTTWRGLDDAVKNSVDEAAARNLMLEHPALIKRPVFDRDGTISVGFTDAVRDSLKS